MQQLSMFVPHAEHMVPGIMSRDYSQVNASVNSFKDVCDTAISAAKSVGMPIKILEAAQELYKMAADAGYGAQDGTTIVETILGTKNTK